MNLGSLLGGGGFPMPPMPPGLPSLPGLGQQGGQMGSPMQGQPQMGGQSEDYQQNLAGLFQLMGGQQQPQNMNLISGGGLI